MTGDWLAGVAGNLEGRVGFEDDHMSVRTHGSSASRRGRGSSWSRRGLGRGAAPGQGRGGAGAIAGAAELADEVYGWAVERGFAGRSEGDVARAADARMRELGAEPSFPPIVAAGPNGALPHAEPGERVIGEGEMLVFDMGAELDGYCSDCTRTFAVGEPGEEAREVYELVRRRRRPALEAVAAGKDGRAVDAVAREIIDAGAHGDHFGHGLGHGVGLEVHEAPRLSKLAPRTRCGRETWSRSSPAFTSPANWASGSRTWSS